MGVVPTVYWQYQWCASDGGETFGPYESGMMNDWQQANIFTDNPARVRRCSPTGQPLWCGLWEPADQAKFIPSADSSEATANPAGMLTRQRATDARDAGMLAKLWWELSRPRKRGKIGAVRGPRVAADSHILLQQWLSARGVDDTLVQEEDQQGFQVFRFARNALTPAQEHWDQAFHGTRWYALWLILTSGVMLASDNKEAGHDFWEPGVYCTPVLGTAKWYAIPHILFGDDVYHRVVMELRVNPAKRKKNRERGGVQWVFPAEETVIRAIWLQSDSPPDSDERRFVHWDHELEALPPGQSPIPRIVNPSRLTSSAEDDYSWHEEIKHKMLSDGRKELERKQKLFNAPNLKPITAPGITPIARPLPNLDLGGGVQLATLITGSLAKAAQIPPNETSPAVVDGTEAAAGSLQAILANCTRDLQPSSALEALLAGSSMMPPLEQEVVAPPSTVGMQPHNAFDAGGANAAPVYPQPQAGPVRRPASQPDTKDAKRAKFLAFAAGLAKVQRRDS